MEMKCDTEQIRYCVCLQKRHASNKVRIAWALELHFLIFYETDRRPT